MKILKTIMILTAITLSVVACQGNKSVKTAMSNEEKFPMTNFTMTDVDGQPVDVLEEVRKHQITIIDFWASWCGPCRAETPHLVSLYERYKAKGLGIIGVSLDFDGMVWKKAVEELKMSWLQLSDLKGWKNEAAQIYGVTSLPYTLLVDGEGNIITSNLRGEALTMFITHKLMKE